MQTDRTFDGSAVSSEKQSISKRIVAAVVIGNALEFYDFVIFAYFSIYIGNAFFPSTDSYTSLLATLGTYALGFGARPVGGILIGAFADRAGRKPAMLLTVTLITIGTIGLAATPSYATIGIWAPIAIIIFRLIQGLAIGGEVGPAASMLVEAAPPGKRGYYASWQIASQGLAVAVGGVIGVIITLILSREDVQAWGWRIPFILSLVLIPIAIKLRRELPETFEERKGQSGAGIGANILKHWGYIAGGVMVMLAAAVSTQLGNYMTTYAIKVLKLPDAAGQAAVLVGGLLTFVTALVAGYWSDRSGRKIAMIAPRILLTILVIPLFMWLHNAPSLLSLLTATAFLAGLTGLSLAATVTAVPELMPIAIRSTGTALVYAITVTLFGGTAQLVVTWMIARTDDALSPAYYIAITGIISLVAMFIWPETKNTDIKK